MYCFIKNNLCCILIAVMCKHLAGCVCGTHLFLRAAQVTCVCIYRLIGDVCISYLQRKGSNMGVLNCMPQPSTKGAEVCGPQPRPAGS